MKKKWITRLEIEKILKTYSIRKDEFRPVGSQEHFYQSCLVQGYTIKIDPELVQGETTVKTGRITVTHSQSSGKKTYQDIWQKNPDGGIEFLFRNLWNQPFSDADYIRELEEKNRQLQQTGQKLQEQLSAVHSDSGKWNDFHELIKDTDSESEIFCLQKQLEDLKEKYQKLKDDTIVHNARGAGRKPSKERLNAISQVKLLLESGCNDQDVINQLGISRATFYRYKKSINN